MSVPIILSGTTGTGTRYVQFWTEHAKVAGQTVPFEYAEMNDGEEFAPVRLSIKHGCPDEWVLVVLATFETFRAGGDIPATHTVLWTFGKPTFTPVTPEPVEPGLFDLLDMGSETAA